MIDYAEGQVWPYRTRRGEEQSLVKIQLVERDLLTTEEVFHISIIGLKWRHADALEHAPVSRDTLDQSVTQQVSDSGQFPTSEEGIAEWKRAKGGVYTVSLAEIAELGELPD